jgi:6-phosphogluconolactonase
MDFTGSMINIDRFETLEDAINHVIDSWRLMASHAIVKSGRFTVALSGGTSPIPLYTALSAKKNLPWALTHVFLVDERFVPMTNVNSNYRMIKETLVDRVPLNASQMHSIDMGQIADAAAMAYAQQLKTFFKLKPNTFPTFDLILLGLGEDGHTASLFTKKDCDEKKRLAIHTRSPKPPHDRITLTLPVLNHAKNIIFFVSGENKKTIVNRVFEEKKKNYPASRIQPLSKEVTVVFNTNN